MSDIKLREKINEQKILVEQLTTRLDQLVDRQKVLEHEVEYFKKRVEQDMGEFKTKVGKDFADVVTYLKKNKK